MQNNFEVWAGQVTSVLQEPANVDLFKDAIAAVEEESEEEMPTTSADFLEWLRCDEPRDAYEIEKLPPQEYANFLIDEWKLFGPRGE